MEVVVSLSSPSCLWAPSPIQLLHAVSHRRIPSEDWECSFRLLLVPRNMKRPMQRAGLAANEQTVGGWLLPHTSAAGGPRGKETQRQGTMNSNKDFLFCHCFKIWTCNLEATKSQGKQKTKRERLNGACRELLSSLCAIKGKDKFLSVKKKQKNSEAFHFDQTLLFVLIYPQSIIEYLPLV